MSGNQIDISFVGQLFECAYSKHELYNAKFTHLMTGLRDKNDACRLETMPENLCISIISSILNGFICSYFRDIDYSTKGIPLRDRVPYN